MSDFLNKILSRNYASLVVFSISLFAIFLFDFEFSALRIALFTGMGQALFTIGMRYWLLRYKRAHRSRATRALKILFTPRPSVSIGALTIGIGAFTLLLIFSFFASPSWNLHSFVAITASFLLSSSLVLALADLLIDSGAAPVHRYRIEGEYSDIFLAALMASVFLGFTFTSLPAFRAHLPYGMVLFPLLLGLASLILTYMAALLTDQFRYKARPLILAFAAIMLTVVAAFLTGALLPETWVKNGTEYSANQVFYIAFAGIAAGFISSRIVGFYQVAARKYIDFLLHKPFKGLAVNLFIRACINGIIPMLPFSTILAALALGFAYGGLYGTALAILCVVSNVNMSMMVANNKLLADNLHQLSDAARRKIRMVSPSFKDIFQDLRLR